MLGERDGDGERWREKQPFLVSSWLLVDQGVEMVNMKECHWRWDDGKVGWCGRLMLSLVRRGGFWGKVVLVVVFFVCCGL